MPLTLEQHRMKHAYDATRAAIDPNGDTKAKREAWERVAKDFGGNVQRSGLLQALAFLLRDTDKGDLKTARIALLKSVKTHLTGREFLIGADANGDLLEIAARLDAATYMFVTREVLAISIWYKRAAQALCGD